MELARNSFLTLLFLRICLRPKAKLALSLTKPKPRVLIRQYNDALS